MKGQDGKIIEFPNSVRIQSSNKGGGNPSGGGARGGGMRGGGGFYDYKGITPFRKLGVY